ncbi:hypothetical protein OMW55_13070 [Sphingomonas sp. BN140010]|uniref:Peptidase M50 domain-containing protein n=1 Tax=Sphingomonas arvum TaxID=2992113 RepID=A0ABT3JI31_9SPHN|nr:hypothetical protein [Sphingomonas sp. BN140010]MCW3798740.1 hypothetical protein [Sphingomonas sp. BN140010]
MTNMDKGWRGLGRLFLLATALTPVTILLHEFGHFAVAVQSGRPVQLHLTSVTGGASVTDPAWLQAAQAGSGPLVTLILTGVGLAELRRGGHLWGLALAGAAVSRLFTDLAYLCVRLLLFALGKPFGGTPSFDEFDFARIVKLNDILVSAIASSVLMLTIWLMWRWTDRARRAVRLAEVLLGVGAAYVPMMLFGSVTILSV